MCCFIKIKDQMLLSQIACHISFPSKATVKLANENTGHDKLIGVILCHFLTWPIIYPLEPVYYFPGDPSNTISFFTLKFYVGFQKVTYEFERKDEMVLEGSPGK